MRRPSVSGGKSSGLQGAAGPAAHRQLPSTHDGRPAWKHLRAPGLKLPDAGSTGLPGKPTLPPGRRNAAPAGGRMRRRDSAAGPPAEPGSAAAAAGSAASALRTPGASGVCPPSRPVPTSARTWSSPRGSLRGRRTGTRDLRPGGRERSGGRRTAARSPRVPTFGPAARRVLTQRAEAPGEEPAAARPTAPASSRGGSTDPGRRPAHLFQKENALRRRFGPRRILLPGCRRPSKPVSPGARPSAFVPSLQLPKPACPWLFPAPRLTPRPVYPSLFPLLGTTLKFDLHYRVAQTSYTNK